MTGKRNSTIVFLILLSIVTASFGYLLVRPYLKAVVSAVVLAIVFYPLHARLHRYVRNANVASFISTMLALLLIIIPATLLGLEITRELTAMRSQNGELVQHFMRTSDGVVKWLGRYVDLSGFDLRMMFREKLQEASGSLLSMTANVIGNLTSFVIGLVVTFLTLFFLFRDGRLLSRRIMARIPLHPVQRRNLIGSISGTVTASMYGVVAVALAQGLLMGTAFWFLRLPSPVLWGVTTAIVSLIPIVGSAIVWLPAALILIINGSWVKGLVLIGWGAGVVGMADNVVRPYIISKAGELHPLLVFFALLGGVQAFGLIGLFVGPVVLAVGRALLDLLRQENHLRAERHSN